MIYIYILLFLQKILFNLVLNVFGKLVVWFVALSLIRRLWEYLVGCLGVFVHY